MRVVAAVFVPHKTTFLASRCRCCSRSKASSAARLLIVAGADRSARLVSPAKIGCLFSSSGTPRPSVSFPSGDKREVAGAEFVYGVWTFGVGIPGVGRLRVLAQGPRRSKGRYFRRRSFLYSCNLEQHVLTYSVTQPWLRWDMCSTLALCSSSYFCI